MVFRILVLRILFFRGELVMKSKLSEFVVVMNVGKGELLIFFFFFYFVYIICIKFWKLVKCIVVEICI